MTNSRKFLACPATRLVAILIALTPIGGALLAQENPDLTSLSIDDLMNVEVTSVSRKGQKLSDTAAAVFVITQDDIRRSGAQSIPEILRIVPGLDVARVSGNVWAISARGSNSQFANKLLVMIDGRSVYSPLFSGVFWDVQDTLLQDIDRIEVIRGPGGTLWGANAVNGIINIITKHAIETQGSMVALGAGTAEGASAAGRLGGSIGTRGHYRVYGKSFDRPQSVDGVTPSNDAWRMGRAGFRADWVSQRGHNFTAQGDIYDGTASALGILVDPGDPFAVRAASNEVEGQDLQFLWTANQSSRSDTTFQAFYDYTARSEPGMDLARRTFDVAFQHHLKVGSRNDIVWGADYRLSDGSSTGPGLHLDAESRMTSIASVFVQNEMAITPRFHLTFGTKLHYDMVTDPQLQPTLRMLFRPSSRQSIWAAATSAVRTPSEIDLNARAVVGAFDDGTGATTLVVVSGNPELKSERVEAFEVGYRWQITPSMAFDATAFHKRMRDLVGTRPGQPYFDPSTGVVVPFTIVNSSSGQANGAEFFLTDAITPNWNVALGYSFFEQTISNDGSVGVSVEGGERWAPRHQVQLRNSIQLPGQVAVDTAAYYVDRIGTTVPAYLRFDAQLSWRLAKGWEFSIAGQNLLDERHAEFENAWSTPAQRTVNGSVTWRH